MFWRGVLLLGVLGVASGPVASQEKEKAGWTVTLLTDGGFVGKGLGNIRVTADGTLSVLDRAGKKVEKEAKVPAEALKALGEAIERAKPAEWKRSYGGGAKARDGFSYDLTLTTKGSDKDQTHRVEWDDNAKELPKDLGDLIKVIRPLLR